MKTFSATHLNKHAQEVFAAAKDDGSVVIEHSNYFGGVFAIVWNPEIPSFKIVTENNEETNGTHYHNIVAAMEAWHHMERTDNKPLYVVKANDVI